ncbi:MAG: bifunctional phosphoribosylaminoimidazolecarboxamide formyltransferase/inosine monophosphate cyclohydrolase [Pelagibacterales bacterium]|nr:bifunctional phosphoribosylaminoimidazolecarboxamide formyltransferase/inosine monophosphate cyclohydrolase [Pelagibacterales bacterium]
MLKINRCLISVSDKTNIIKFAETISKNKIEIVSTGNTYRVLYKNGIKATKVEKISGFPEVLEGRVKTLHPKIFGGILADPLRPNHKRDMINHNLKKFDLVVVNLYPFEAITSQTSDLKKCIENIDVGGPSMIRAAAKNYSSTAIIVDIQDYNEVLEEIINLKGISLDLRKKLAGKAFARTMKYDAKITGWMNENLIQNKNNDLLIYGEKINNLRYGENPHQKSTLYSTNNNRKLFYEQLNGKELSYNNLNDLKLGLKLSSEFSEPACVIIKHAIPSSVAISNDIYSAWNKAFNADSLSAFGGVVVLNKLIDEKLANKLNKIFLEVIVAPSFTAKALTIFSKKPNLRIIKIKNIKKLINSFKKDVLLFSDILLSQDVDNAKTEERKLKTVTKKKPTRKEIEDLIFAYKVVKYVRSNAIVIAKNKTTLGIGSGNTSRVDSVQFAIFKAKRAIKGNKNGLKGSVLASDAFFPFSDSIKLAGKAKVSAIIQPGGSISDTKVIEDTNKEKISMVFSERRCFSH